MRSWSGWANTSSGNTDTAQVFAEYAEPEEASRAQTNLAGRKFNGHVVLTCFFDEEEYANRDFTAH